jgi:hypothetical protein
LPIQNPYKTATGTAGTLADGYNAHAEHTKMAHPQKGEPLVIEPDNIIISFY